MSKIKQPLAYGVSAGPIMSALQHAYTLSRDCQPVCTCMDKVISPSAVLLGSAIAEQATSLCL